MVRLIKTLQQALKMDREKFKVPRSVQQAIPVQRIWPDGVFQSGPEGRRPTPNRTSVC